jgi:hypothetical protein
MEIAGLATVAAQHLGSYVELLGQAAGEYRAAFLRRALLVSGAIVMAVATLAAAWTTGLALLWDTAWRVNYCIGSAVLCMAATTALALLAVRRTALSPHSRTLRDEAAQDIAPAKESGEEPHELDADGDHFPRSKVMRFALDPRNRNLLVFSGSLLARALVRNKS